MFVARNFSTIIGWGLLCMFSLSLFLFSLEKIIKNKKGDNEGVSLFTRAKLDSLLRSNGTLEYKNVLRSHRIDTDKEARKAKSYADKYTKKNCIVGNYFVHNDKTKAIWCRELLNAKFIEDY